MNIVWLTPEIPYPPYGGRNGVFHRIEQLSRYNKIYLFSIAYSEEEKKTESDMRKYCKEAYKKPGVALLCRKQDDSRSLKGY